MTEQRGLTEQQVGVLLQPIMPGRVHRDPGGNSYLPQQDVRAHLTRLFGFAGWSLEVLEVAEVYSAPTLSLDKKTKQRDPERVDCLWRATVRLTVRDQHGNELARYEDAATGDAQNQTPLAGPDLALKSAVSTALKRAATCLGDQFGLSLYNKGNQDAFVRQTLVGATAEPHELTRGEVPAATEEQDPDRRPERDDPHPPEGDPTPEERAESAVSRRHAARQAKNSARRGPEVDKAKARLWDAVSEIREGAERTAELEKECARRQWNSPAQLHPDRLAELADYYEEQADDAIRQRIIDEAGTDNQ